MEVPGLTITKSPSRYRLAFRFILAFRAGFAMGSPPRYSTPPLASNSSGIVPARNNSTAGCQSPSSGSLVRDHAMAPACRDASRAPILLLPRTAGGDLYTHKDPISDSSFCHEVQD